MEPRRLASMVALVLPAFLYGLYRFSLGVLVPGMETAYSMTDASAGGLLSASVGAVGLGVISSGYVASRMGDLKAILAGFVLFAIPMAGVAVSTGVVSFAAFFVLAAFGSGLMITPSYAVAASMFPDRKGFAASFVTSFYSFAGFLGPSSAGFLLASYGWHAPFAEFAAIGTVFLLVVFAVLGRGAGSSSASPVSMFRELLRRRVIAVLAVAAFFADFGFLVYLSWTPKFLLSAFGASGGSTTIDFLFGAGLGLGGLGTLVGGALFDRIGGRKSATTAAALPAAAMAGVFLAGSYVLAMVFVVVTGILANMFWALITAMCQVNVSEDRRTAATSLVQTSGFVGAFLGPGVAGVAGGPVSPVLLATAVVPYLALMSVVVLFYHDPPLSAPPRT